LYFLAGIQDKKKGPPAEAGGPLAPSLERRVAGFCSALTTRRSSGNFRFRPAQSPDGIRADAPEDGELRGLSFLGLAVLALVLGADELSVNQDMVALVDRVRDGLTEAIGDRAAR